MASLDKNSGDFRDLITRERENPFPPKRLRHLPALTRQQIMDLSELRVRLNSFHYWGKPQLQDYMDKIVEGRRFIGEIMPSQYTEHEGYSLVGWNKDRRDEVFQIRNLFPVDAVPETAIGPSGFIFSLPSGDYLVSDGLMSIHKRENMHSIFNQFINISNYLRQRPLSSKDL